MSLCDWLLPSRDFGLLALLLRLFVASLVCTLHFLLLPDGFDSLSLPVPQFVRALSGLLLLACGFGGALRILFLDILRRDWL